MVILKSGLKDSFCNTVPVSSTTSKELGENPVRSTPEVNLPATRSIKADRGIFTSLPSSLNPNISYSKVGLLSTDLTLALPIFYIFATPFNYLLFRVVYIIIIFANILIIKLHKFYGEESLQGYEEVQGVPKKDR